jgi:3D (Asp-Asp-Asp) domain-containing protein
MTQPAPIPSIQSATIATQYTPNAQIWREDAERLQDENQRLRDEIERLKATQWRTFTATAYTADCREGCTGITATGLDVRNRTHVDGARVIATDPAVIPLGTTVELRFDDGSTERAIAVDTGGAIDGEIIDYLVSDYDTAIQFGRRTVDVRIIEEA